MNVGMQEVGWICNLWLLWQMCGGQHPPVTTSCWANPPPGHPGLSVCLEHLTLSTHVHQSPEAQLQDQTLVRAFSEQLCLLQAPSLPRQWLAALLTRPPIPILHKKSGVYSAHAIPQAFF